MVECVCVCVCVCVCIYITNILQLIINIFCRLQKTGSVAGLIYGEIQKFGILSNICRHT